LAKAAEIRVDVAGSEAFEGITLLVQVEEETPDVPVSDLASGQRQPPSLALYLEEIFEPRIIATGRWIRIVRQAAKPFQKAASDGVKLFLRPAKGGSPSLSHASRCPGSGEGLDLSRMEAMLSRPPLDLTGDA
jgi:hypothetical protein